MGNPFQETSEDLIVLDTKDIADPEIVTTVKQVEAWSPTVTPGLNHQRTLTLLFLMGRPW